MFKIVEALKRVRLEMKRGGLRLLKVKAHYIVGG